MNEAERFQRFAKEFESLCANSEVLKFELTRQEMWSVFAQLQLALRHPGNIGRTRIVAERVARRLQAIVASSGALAEVATMGWDPQHDP